MENKMAEVAKLLGVELNEEFGLKNSNFRYKLTTYGLRKRYHLIQEWSDSSMLDDLLLGRVEIVKKAKSILDDAEKKYLGNIIKPFRDKVEWVRKFSSPNHRKLEYIKISYQDCTRSNVLNFPDFKVGTMYRGMKIGKAYTLKELGL